MVNDIKPKDPDKNMLVKFADDMTVSAPVTTSWDTASNEVKNIRDWTYENRMTMSKTWEMVISKRSLNQLPPPINGIERKEWLTLLGVSFQDDPCCWDIHVDGLLSKASGRMHILRVCKLYGYPRDQLTKLFETLILSLFTYAIEVWGSALLKKYLKRIDQFFKRANRYGYTDKEYNMSSLIEERDKTLFGKIIKDTEHSHYDLLPDKKQRTLRAQIHDYTLPQVKRESSFGQRRPPLTELIASILVRYPDGGQILKELIQNADDAGATEVKFLYDDKTHGTQSLLTPELGKFQGPALYCYNDAVFSDHDFKNINKLAGATKVEELEKIGRFGLGFNAVYHLTDVPSFVSREYFVLFDPNINHIENHIPDKSRPGIRIDLSSNPRPLSVFEDQFQPYHGMFGCSTQIADGTKFNFSGTLFRFPFRTSHDSKKSDICQSVYDEVKVREIISSLKECSSLLLLFTQHVTKVELYEIENCSDPSDMRLLLSVSKQGSKIKRSSDSNLSKRPFIEECSNWWRHELVGSSFIQQITPSRCEVFKVVTKEMPSNLMQSQSKSDTRETWLVASCGGTDTSVSLASGEGRSRGLLPCGGAAARLNSVPSDESKTKLNIDAINGEAFCFLPLSIPTGLPIHVNGYFAVTSNRRGIWERTTSSQHQVFEVRWNEALLSDALCTAYLQLLNDVKGLPTHDCSSYTLWPVHDKLPSSTWGKLVESVYEKIVSNSLPLFYSDGKWLSIKEGYILDDELRQVPKVCNTLKTLKKDVFDIPLNVLSSMNKAGQKKAVLKSTLNLKTFLEKLFLPNIRTISSNIRDPIICFILDRILRGRSEFETLLNSYQCITCSEDGEHLAKPSSLINPKGPAACLFSSEDHRFPFGDCFLEGNRMYALELLGMVNEQISWSEICDRARSVSAISRDKGLERTKNLIKYLKENIEKLPKPDSSSLSDLRRTEFLPFISKCPKGYELPWHGSTLNKQQLFAPNDVFLSSEKHLVGSSCVIVDDSDETGCAKLGRQVKELLGFVNRFPKVQDVLGQLDAAISVNDVTSGKRKSLESVCMRVYKFLDHFLTRVYPDDTSEGKLLLKELSSRSWLFINGHFVPTRKAAYKWVGSGAPYLYSVPFDYRENYSKLLSLAGVRETFSHVDFIDALKSLQETKAGLALSKNEIKLAVCFATALKDAHHEIESSQIGKIPLPDSNNVLCMSGELTINLTFWLKDRGDARYVHQDVPSQLALDLGAQSLQNRRLKKYSSTIATPFGQHEKLTDRLKNILKSYPCDSGILKELVQNADDAGASEIHFIYDTRELPHEKVLQNHAEEVQGPALCVYNDKPFTEEDLEGIQKLGIGSKTDDPEKTGQYGIGFNAVYHLTDCPSFLSDEDTLCFLDPHCRYAPEATPDSPGEKFQQIDDEFREDFKDVLVGYLGEYFNLKKATMFRLPLRTFETSRNSLISQNIVANYKFRELLQKFETESKKMLLFLNHVKKISISEVNKDGQLKQLYSVISKLEVENEEKRRKLSDIIKRSKHLPTGDVEWCGITYPLTTSDSNNVNETWIVHQCCGTSHKTTRDSIPDGRQYGLFPRGGIAALVTPQRSASEPKPQYVAYCFLPLPVETRLPVHVNGHFALDSSRRDLWHDTDQNSPLTKWNNFIKASVLAPGYATLILEARRYIPFSQGMAEHNCRGLFSNNLDAKQGLFWYHKLFPTPSKDSPWYILAHEVYHYMGSNNLEVLPVVVADDKPVEKTHPQPNPQNESSNDVIHRVRFWLSARDAYFIEGKGQLKLDEDRLFKLLLRVNLPLLLYSPTMLYYRFSSAEVTCNTLTPLTVINFMRSFSDANSNCHVGNLPINLMKSNIREIAALKVLIQYCQREEKFPDFLEGLPILLTADGQLRVFDSGKPVYRSTFSDLFPEDENLFVHPDLVYSVPDVDKLPENRVMQLLTVNALNQHFPRVFPVHMRGTSEHVAWDFPQNGPLSRKWFQRVWDFLQNHINPKLNNNEMPLSVLGVWPIIPTTSDKLVTIDNGKTVLDATRRSTDSAQGKRIRDILEKLDCPRLNTDITVKKPKVQTSVTSASQVGRFLPQFGTVLEVPPADDNSHVTDSHVAQPHNVPDVLQVLDFVRRTGCLDTSGLSTEELSAVLSFVQDDIDNLTTEHATILKHLPIYIGIDGTYFSLTDYLHSAVIPHGVPTSEMAKLQTRTGCLFLNTTSAAILHQLFKWLGVGVELSFPEFYRKYIIPCFEIFNRDSQILYLTHIKEDVLPLLQTGSSKQKAFVDFLTGSLCIPDEEGDLHYAREFHDPRNEVFQIMLEDNSDHFPPAAFRSHGWLEFLTEIGMKTKVEENQFLEFCQEVALYLDPTTDIEKSKILVNYLFNSEHLRSEEFLCSLSSISFIAPEKVESSLLSLHRQFQCNTIDDEPPFVQFFEAVPWKYHVLTWTSAALLPPWAQPDEKLQRYLGVQEVPSVESIVSHLQNLSSSLAEICRRDEVLPQSNLLKKIMISIYEGLSKELNCSDAKDISDGCSQDCKSIGKRLSGIPCVLVEEGMVMVPGDRLSFETRQFDSTFIPFLYTVPRRYCTYEHLMKRLGATEKFTSLQFATVLKTIRDKCQNTKMNPNLFEKARAAMTVLFQCLLVESHGGNKTKICDLTELFLPSEKEILVKSSELILKIAPRYKSALANRANLNVLLPLEKCDLPREKENEYLNALPQRLRPKLMESLFNEVLDPNCLNKRCSLCKEDGLCDFIKSYILVIRSPEFHSAIIRLLKHKKNSTELTEDEESQLSVFSTNKLEIICMHSIKVHLIETKTKEPLVNSAIGRQCYVVEENKSWKLYIKHKAEEAVAIHLAYCIDRIAYRAFDESSLRYISGMLLCKSPSQIPGILDQFNIAEDYSEEELKIGVEVPMVYHYLLQQNPLFIFHAGEIVAYGIEVGSNEMAEGIEDDGFMDMKYVLAKVISRVDEEDDPCDFTAEYLIDLGNEHKKVSVVDLYKFVQDDAGENQTYDLVPFTGDPTCLPSSLDEAKKEIREAILKAWRLPAMLRRKVIRRLYLRWHPDKNPDNFQFAGEMFRFLLSEIKRMEAEESGVDHSCGFSTLFTGWSRRARRERETYVNFRGSFGGSCPRGGSSPRSVSDYTYPDVFESRRWLRQARRDLEAAQLLLSSSQSFDALVCFLSHQVVEKSLKGALYAKCGLTNDQLHTHDVYFLANYVCQLRDSPAEITDLAIVVGNYYLTTRYPNQQPGAIVPADAFSTDQSERAFESAQGLLEAVETFVSE
ncbi:LOW QUALITY PROTEIN: sacsin-like [Dendronephthya gigantea]|uniref:LOW QUALITY PROTEIN: sacsin-like n=1 Tax=Dendronephthya gigantea TaxID=151771 RepID=UPI0010692235|nr:LOW QUALITY PROTEIN: sacsin-like [Dendronephthya gigantea]